MAKQTSRELKFSFIIPNEELKYFPGQKKVTVIPDL